MEILERNGNKLIIGDALDALRTLADRSVDCCITSPPYFRMRDYGIRGQLGSEERVEDYVDRLCAITAQVWRVLADDGTFWLNIADTYADSGKGAGTMKFSAKQASNKGSTDYARELAFLNRRGKAWSGASRARRGKLSPKQASNRGSFSGASEGAEPGEHERLCPRLDVRSRSLLLVPARLSIALAAQGWVVRSDNIWAKLNSMPESTRNRPTRSHEHFFQLTKSSSDYHYDYDAVLEPCKDISIRRLKYAFNANAYLDYFHGGKHNLNEYNRSEEARRRAEKGRNRRDVWPAPSAGYRGAHFATFPVGLIRPLVAASTRPGGRLLDPFMGSGTVAEAAVMAHRKWTGIELNPNYKELILERSRWHDIV